jgi:hypothetical protein
MIWDIDLIFGMRVYTHKLQINFEIHFGWMIFGLLLRELKKGETFASLLNIHGGDIPFRYETSSVVQWYTIFWYTFY